MSRKVVKRSTHRVVGYLASQKNGMLVPWESQIEKAYFEWLEVDPDILKFRSQPRTFKWTNIRYTPDALVTDCKGSFFVEVKPDSVFSDSHAMERLDAIGSNMKLENYDFRLVTERDIFAEPLRSNVTTIMRHRRVSLGSTFLQLLNSDAFLKPQILGNLGWLEDSNMFIQMCAAIAQGLLEADLRAPLSSDSILNYKREHG